MSSALETFRRWFCTPLRELEKLPDGDGAFVALAVSCFLYERYATAILKESGTTADDAAKRKQLASDFGVDLRTAEAFWDVIRNGFLHQGMGKQVDRGVVLPSWSVSESYPVLVLDAGTPGHLRVQPWRFRDRVLELWKSRHDLIEANSSFPWATISKRPA
jgi:hypothetical protein